MKIKRKKIKLNKPLNSYKTGTVLEILCDKRGVPVDRYWRNRFKDAKIDNCIEVVEKKTEEEKPKAKPEKQK